ncbi:MAG TPA: aldose 1-epimerase family protein [Anaerolineae bacterium]|nr:aldose 1-epimerase family protein [Anaerolineae bacterium]
MARLFDRQWSRAELLSRVGDLSQLAGIRLAEWSDGAERGVRVANLRTGSGFEFSVLLDRGMDLGPASFGGTPLAWLSPAGFSHPAHFEPQGLGWLRTFGGGLMTGCGLAHLGAPNEDEGESLGLHGRLSLLPARHVQSGEEWQGDECCFWVQGQMRQARLFGENLRLTRRVSCWLGQSRLSVHDRVENLAATPSPLMILYHINLGFPLLDSSCQFVAQPHAVRPRDNVAGPGIGEWMRFQPPTLGYSEQVFYHDLPAGSDGWAAITLRNPTLNLSLTVRFQKATLPNLIQWKMMGEGAYVLGLEPANCRVEGRSSEREQGTLQFLQPGEHRDFTLEIAVDEG